MANKIVWDAAGARLYETGVDRGVLFPMATDGTYDAGVAWNGLTAVTESPSGAEASPQYADNIKYLNLYSLEEFNATLEAFTYPDEFGVCDGSVDAEVGVALGQQGRRQFALAYRTLLGNDVLGNDLGYKLHLVWGAMASPSEKGYNTVNDSPEAITFSWEITTTPVDVTGFKPTAHMVIDSTKVDAADLTALEVLIYGVADPDADAAMPTPDEVVALFPAG